MEVTVADLKANLSEILRKAAAGEDISVTRHGRPYVKMTPAKKHSSKLPRVGAFEGQFKLPDNWDAIPTGMDQVG